MATDYSHLERTAFKHLTIKKPPIGQGGFGLAHKAYHVHWGVLVYKELIGRIIDENNS